MHMVSRPSVASDRCCSAFLQVPETALQSRRLLNTCTILYAVSQMSAEVLPLPA